jgi:hypothetical protein
MRPVSPCTCRGSGAHVEEEVDAACAVSAGAGGSGAHAPKRARTRANRPSTNASSVTSPGSRATSTLVEHSSAASRRWCSRRATRTTVQPACESSTAVARPIPARYMSVGLGRGDYGTRDSPELAPVMIATLRGSMMQFSGELTVTSTATPGPTGEARSWRRPWAFSLLTLFARHPCTIGTPKYLETPVVRFVSMASCQPGT